MTTDEIITCSYRAMAIVHLCAHAAAHIDSAQDDAQINDLACNVGTALEAAYELMGPVHDALECSASDPVPLRRVDAS